MCTHHFPAAPNSSYDFTHRFHLGRVTAVVFGRRWAEANPEGPCGGRLIDGFVQICVVNVEVSMI